MDCNICEKPCISKARPKKDEIFGAPCDGCKLIFCKHCANLSTTEADAVALSNRNLIFFCHNCKHQLKDLPDLKIIINSLDIQNAKCKEKDIQIEILQNKLQDTTQELQGEINELVTENTHQATHIKRLRRKTQDFEDFVLTNEQENNLKIENQIREIQRLNNEMVQLLDSNKTQTTLISELKSKVHTLESKNKDLEQQNHNLSNKLSSLSHEKDILTNNLKETKYELMIKSGNNLDYADTINSYKIELEEGERVVKELKGDINNLLTLNKEEEDRSQQLKKELEDLQTQCREMVSTIRVLELENNRLSTKLKDIREDIPLLSYDSDHNSVVNSFISSLKERNNQNLLFLSDDHGKNFFWSLSDSINKNLNNFRLQHIFKPGASMLNVIENTNTLTRGFTGNDYVLIMAGFNDFVGNRYPDIKSILDMVEKCSHTNFIIFSVPYLNPCNDFNYKTNLKIFRYNSRLRYLIDIFNSKSENVIHYVDFNAIKSSTYKITLKRRCDIVLRILTSNNVFKQKNLIFIKTTSSFENSQAGDILLPHEIVSDSPKQVQNINVKDQNSCFNELPYAIDDNDESASISHFL